MSCIKCFKPGFIPIQPVVLLGKAFALWLHAVHILNSSFKLMLTQFISGHVQGQILGNLWTRPWKSMDKTLDLGNLWTRPCTLENTIYLFGCICLLLGFLQLCFHFSWENWGLWQRQDSGIKWHYQMQGMLKWAMSMRSGFCFYQHHQSQRYLQCHHPRKMQLITIIIYL